MLLQNPADIVDIYMAHEGSDDPALRAEFLRFMEENLNKEVFVSVIRAGDDAADASVASSEAATLSAADDAPVVSMAMLVHYLYVPNTDCYRQHGNNGIIMNVHTLPAYRGRGYASQCVEECVNLARDKGYAYLYCNSVENVTSLYTKLGFSEDPKTTFLEKYL